MLNEAYKMNGTHISYLELLTNTAAKNRPWDTQSKELSSLKQRNREELSRLCSGVIDHWCRNWIPTQMETALGSM